MDDPKQSTSSFGLSLISILECHYPDHGSVASHQNLRNYFNNCHSMSMIEAKRRSCSRSFTLLLVVGGVICKFQSKFQSIKQPPRPHKYNEIIVKPK